MVIRKKTNGTWAILFTFFLAYFLAVVPFPVWAMDYRPEWVPMVLIYWVMALPYRVGVGWAWVIGIILDVLEGSILGLNAMSLVIIAYITLSLHLRLRMFAMYQQAGLVLVLVGLNLLLSHWLKVLTGQITSANIMFLMAALISAIIWPSLFQILRHIRRSFEVR